MILAIQTQYRENYGDEENPHWKSKGGSTYLVTDLSDSEIADVDLMEIRNLIDYANPMSEEWVIGVSIEADDYTSDYEKWQKEDECATSIYYDTRIVRREDGTYVATDQFKGSGGSYVKTWNMAPAGEKENYSYTETLAEAV